MRKGPSVTYDHIERIIVSEHYFTAGEGRDGSIERGTFTAQESPAPDDSDLRALELLTFCVLVLRNGFTVTGESACVSPDNFNHAKGRAIARANAVEKIWALEGYLLKQKMCERAAILHDLPHPANAPSQFAWFEGKPTPRLAYQIRTDDIVTKVAEATYELALDEGEVTGLRFRAYEDVLPGDYIVYLNDDDIYHCNEKVFRSRNVI